jgi:predicted metalloendopeptidase
MKTLGENLADNGGLSHAYRAYHSYLKKNGPEPKLPGFENFTSDQLFFIAFGSIWCETISADELESQIEFDEHSPNNVRVIGSLQNSQEFSRAFECPVGSRMNPSDNKCKVW